MIKGTVKALNKNGYGYISIEGEERNAFFHCSQVIGDMRFDNFELGMEVEVGELNEAEYKGVLRKECFQVKAIK